MLLAAVVIGLLVRGGIAFGNLSSFSSDPDAYRAIAETLANSGVYGLQDPLGEAHATAFRPPLYPYLLSWITTSGKLGNVAVAALHTILAAMTLACTFLASRRLLGESTPAAISLIAAILVAVDPILVQQSTLVMTETLATALVSAVICWWSYRYESFTLRGSAVLGVLLALAFLCRPTFLVWAAMICLAVVFAGGKSRTLITRSLSSVVVGLIVLITVGLWTLRNERSVGHPIWATSHGGYTLLLGNNPSFYDYLQDGIFGIAWDPAEFFLAYSHRYDGDPNGEEFWRKPWDQPATILQRVSEHEDDRVAYDAARATIDRQKKQFVWSCLVRLGRLWTPIPHRTPDRSWLGVAAIGAYYSFFYLAMFVGLWRLGRAAFTSPWWPIWSLAITLSLVHAVYWSNLRMRAPIVPGLAILAAATFVNRDPKLVSRL